jgi:hypothetical protein
MKNMVTKYRYREYGDKVSIDNTVAKYQYREYGDKVSIYRI